MVRLLLVCTLASEPPSRTAVAAATGKCQSESWRLFGRAAAEVGGKVEQPHSLTRMPDAPTCKAGRMPEGAWLGVELVGPDGAVHGLWVVQEPTFDPPCPEWSQAVARGIREGKFRPAKADGVPVPYCLTVTASPLLLTAPEK